MTEQRSPDRRWTGLAVVSSGLSAFCVATMFLLQQDSPPFVRVLSALGVLVGLGLVVSGILIRRPD